MGPNEMILNKENCIKCMMPVMLELDKWLWYKEKGWKWNFVWLGAKVYWVRCYGCEQLTAMNEFNGGKYIFFLLVKWNIL